ncbi:hypothetical protein CR203_03890 [Salipaludibacillus neizhouensis]|uniref:Uncharacterized protein n=1 Tax=Salipaludibacillus neizhouensis TaxID=885475 RepID=A0A3A9KHZ3_9BACI|nr:hypothetical protein [Salipaludibacillus neizhouensis]RKL69183.1 hypothetical protein CR203_03890 [Salipaludibacillus neizhouensis]
MARLTAEEEHITESYILLEMARKVLEKDLAHIGQAPIKLKDPYIRLLEVTLHRLSKELYTIKMSMKTHGLKIQLNNHDENFSEYIIFFHGYVLTAKYLNTHLKNKVSHQIENLFTQNKQESQ